MPSLPLIGGFALVASYTTAGDGSLPPYASLASMPASPVAPNTPVTLVWATFNVAKVRITAFNSSPPFDTGIIANPTVSGGTLVIPSGFPSTRVFGLYTYDLSSNLLSATSVYFLVVT
jgi:hypothetical protein